MQYFLEGLEKNVLGQTGNWNRAHMNTGSTQTQLSSIVESIEQTISCFAANAQV